jgi:hypothetical protein
MAKAHRTIPPLRPQDVARFWSKVDRSGGPDACWPWKAGRLPNGYGAFCLSHHNHGAHRIAWIVANGSIVGDLYVCHHCDNHPCCNPSHLFSGTPRDNNLDCMNKGRTARGARNGHALHPDSTMRGIRHPMHKLCDTDVVAIRDMRSTGAILSHIAQEFGVCISTISMICRRELWSHVP